MSCQKCKLLPARLLRPSNSEKLCIQCFTVTFETDIHLTIQKSKMFSRKDRVAVCVSGGKDSTVLAHILTKLNKQYDYGLHLELLSIDEGIKGYRDDSLQIVKENQKDYQLNLTILSYKDLYGMSMDDVMTNKNNIKKNSCSYCGVFRRQALEKGAKKLNCDKMVLGHNADDLAETVLLNYMRGDIEKLQICTTDQRKSKNSTITVRLKPLKYAYEKEIVLYAHYLNLKYFSTECTYAPASTRQFCRNFIKKLERLDPQYILNIIKYAERIQEVKEKSKSYNKCNKCNSLTPNFMCKACVFVEDLSKK